MHAEIVDAALQKQRTYGVRHTADADLQASSILDLAGDQAGDGPVDLGWRRAREFGSRLVIALDQIINLASMYAILLAIHVGQTVGHLDDDQLGALDNRALPKVRRTEIEKAVLIHRTGLQYHDIDRINEAPIIIGNFAEIAGNVMAIPASALGGRSRKNAN